MRRGDEVTAAPRPPAVASEDGLTRRQVVVGGAVVIAGAVAASAVGWRSWRVRNYWYRVTGAYGPAGALPPSYDVTYRYGRFRSRYVSEEVEYGYAFPPELSPAAGAKSSPPVCVCLPGRGRGPAEVLQGSLRLGDFAADAVETGGVKPFVLAAVRAGDTYWHHRRGGDDAMTMLLEEFIPRLREDVSRRGSLAVMGWSMGGYGAIHAAELRPELFAGLCAVSPALWRSYDDGVGDAFDSAEDYRANDVYASAGRLRDLRVRVDCGNQDPFRDAAGAFVDALPKPPAGGFEDGGHNDAYWRRVAPAEMEFIGAALAGA